MGLTLGQNSKVRTSLRARSPFEEYREKQTRQRHARGDAKAEGGGVALRLPRTAFKQKIRDRFFRIFDAEESYVPRGFAVRSRVLSRFASLAQIGKLARRLSTNLWQSVQNQRERELFTTRSKQLESDYFMKQLCENFFILVARDWVCVVSNCTMGLLGRCNFFYWLLRGRAENWVKLRSSKLCN